MSQLVWYFSFKRRMLYVLLASIAFIVFYYIGSISNISLQEANLIKEQFLQRIKSIDNSSIFLNNFIIASTMFIPGLGLIIGLFAAYNTGAVFKAFALTSPLLSNISSLYLLITPFGIMELYSYGLAMSQSIILLNAILKRKLDRKLLYSTVIQYGIVASILFIAAVIEYEMLRSVIVK